MEWENDLRDSVPHMVMLIAMAVTARDARNRRKKAKVKNESCSLSDIERVVSECAEAWMLR